MPDRRKLHEGAQMATNTKHRERRSMAEAPASAGDNGADAAPATPYNHSPAQPHQLSHLYTYVQVYYYLPREKLQRSHAYYARVAPVYALSINRYINRSFLVSRSFVCALVCLEDAAVDCDRNRVFCRDSGACNTLARWRRYRRKDQ